MSSRKNFKNCNRPKKISKEIYSKGRSSYFNKNEDNQCVQVLWFGLGSIIIGNTFACRSQYFSGLNTYSSTELHHLETTCNYAAGNHQLLSYIHINNKKTTLRLDFCIPILPGTSKLNFQGYRTYITYRNIRKIYIDLNDKNVKQTVIYIKIKQPLLFWKAIPNTSSTVKIMNTELCRHWRRCFNWPSTEKCSGITSDIMVRSNVVAISIPKDNALSNVNSYRRGIYVKEGEDAFYSNIICEMLFILYKDYNIPIVNNKMERFFMKHIALMKPPVTKSFSINYSLEALNCRNFYITDQLFKLDESGVPLFYLKVLQKMNISQVITEFALNRLLSFIDIHGEVNIIETFETLFTQGTKLMVNDENQKNSKTFFTTIPKNCLYIRKVLVTPCKIVLLPPEVMMTNRVVRKFGENSCIRVVFRDDDGTRIHIRGFYRTRSEEDEVNLISDFILNPLLNGLNIAGIRYNFLGWSNSQMRDHGAYFFRDTEIINSTTGLSKIYKIIDVRRWMGDFTKCSSLPKMMARMGQCFTQTQPVICLKETDYIVIDDIYGGYNYDGTKFCFSDGCGTISLKMASTLASILKLDYIPSVFQIRFKGFKGILSIDNSIDNSGQAYSIIFRKSQLKFDIYNNDSEAFLEVVKYSMPAIACFNRQLIVILDQVGYKQCIKRGSLISKTLMYYFMNEIRSLFSCFFFSDEAAKVAMDRCNSHINFYKLHESGIDLAKEPFFRKIIGSIIKVANMNLMKLKLDFPKNCARTMYGLMDETGTLMPGQVFVQYSQNYFEPNKNVILHQGKVMVTKHPCRSPGDVRILETVNVPALKHLVDVIVFPKYGWRPHPDEMAGSDLDGDEYVVIFDKNLFFRNNEPASSYLSPSPRMCNEEISDLAMADFFINFIKHDYLGILSNAHLVHADINGIFTPICTELAKKCSIAVDFCKTGVSTQQLQREEKSECAPDFLQPKSNKIIYESKRIIGIIFRKVNAFNHFTTLYQSIHDKAGPTILDEVFKMKMVDMLKYPKVYEKVKSSYKEYIFRLEILMAEYGIDDEASIVSNSIVNLNRISDMEKMDFTFYHSEQIVDIRYKHIISIMRKQFFYDFGIEVYNLSKNYLLDDFKISKVMAAKARMWYTLAYTNSTDINEKPSLKSFAWIIWDVLSNMKKNYNKINNEYSILQNDELCSENN
ncbi:RNA-dependent RNA polymerase, eukaryotic-type family-containing protein [Strongyloides ratti]|uniref:RNA-dependent RNA polymerase n=1 Tax=Strongyloides ratti TaxID=34506 RepID=A0A090L1M2_STRRB|nr:RNA-dependent RNA polymerase, eukaryotic-type family-containing protein [Strongyloides ratti]CEF62017.1 RNA-dependent RNA polymerase, eukaryotic-type family-containing protein [Strongyloides ratti]